MEQPNNHRNLILAIVLSALVMIGWQVFYAGPRLQEEQARQERIAAEQKAKQQASGPSVNPSVVPGVDGTIAPAATAVNDASRADALKFSPRIAIDTPALTGSIALKGARIDDLVLRRYREEASKASANVTLLTPSGADAAFYAELGFGATPGSVTKAPGPDTLWQASGSGPLTPQSPLALSWDNGEGIVFRRKIAVDADYMFTITDKIENKSAVAAGIYPYALVARHGEPKTPSNWILHEGLVGILTDGQLKEYTYSDLRPDDEGNQLFEGTSGWLGITDKYWAAVLIPVQTLAYKANFRRFEDLTVSNPVPQVSFQADYTLPAVTIAPGATYSLEQHLFAGAKNVGLIDDYKAKLSIPRFEYLIDWGWFFFITKPLFYAIDWLNKFLGNFGLAILVVTVAVKALFFPLANKSYAAMSQMKKLQPEMQKIQARLKDDKVKQQQEIMALYKREKVNPISGCVPVMLQIPVFFALYKVLFTTIEMRHAPFFGWIGDLSAPDPTTIFNLFGLIPWNPGTVPLLGPFLLLGVWPIIMGLTMWLQMKLNPAPADPVQAKMFAWMPLIFTFMLAAFPAGLVIYWAWNNLLSIAQQWLIMSKHGVEVKMWENLKADVSWLIPKGLGKS